MNNLLKHTFFLILGTILCLTLTVEGFGQQLSDSELLENVDPDELQNVITSYKGEKAVLVNVWATWCGPCKEEFPHIVELQKKYPDQLQVIFVSTDFSREPALKFLRNHHVDWTTYYSTVQGASFITSLSDSWTGAMPFTLILDAQGNRVASWENSADFDKFESHVKQAIHTE